MNTPLVSVIVPCYNHERYVEECIKSIVEQDYSNFELIVIDDGSKDKSAVVIKELADKYQFKYKIQQNIGLTATLNKALRSYVNGKYIIILASDDIMYPKRIKKQVEFMEENSHYGMSYSNAFVIDENSKIIGESKLEPKSGWLFRDLFLANFNIPAYTCIYRYDAMEKVGFYDEKAFIEDSDMYYKISRLFEIGYLDIIAAYYRRHESNMSKRYVDLFNDTMRRIDKYKEDPLYAEALFNAKKKWFFLLSFDHKYLAVSLLSTIISKPFNKFFIGGCANLLGFTFLTRKFIR